MKIEQIILLHLYKHNRVTLQGIGTFYLNPSISRPSDIAGRISLPGNAVTFMYDPNAAEDDSLLESVVQYTKKLKPLAAADLGSFLQWQKQLLNINLPFEIGNVGVLQKTPQGAITFIPNETAEPKAAGARPGSTRNSVGTPSEKHAVIPHTYGKRIAQSLAIIVIISLTIWTIYQFTGNGTSGDKNLTQNPVSKHDSVKPGVISARSHKKIEDSACVFKVVLLKTRSREEALKTLNEIYGFGHSAVMYASDSLYKIAMPFNRPFNDTSRIKDSLDQYYSLSKRPVEIE